MNDLARGHVDVRLPVFLSGGAPAAERAEIEAHLDSCERCRRTRDELAALRKTLARDEASAPIRDVWTYVDARLRPGAPALLRFRFALGAAAAVGIAAGLLLGVPRSPESAGASDPLWSSVGSPLVGDTSPASALFESPPEDGGAR